MREDFDPTKPCWTKDGRKVTIYTTEHCDQAFPLVGAVEGETRVLAWTRSGRITNVRNNPWDITNTAPKKKYQAWANLYHNGILWAYPTKEIADFQAGSSRIECRLIEWEG